MLKSPCSPQAEDDGLIGQLVWDRDTAWHAGNWNENCRSIGVEHANRSDGTVSEACLDAALLLCLALLPFVLPFVIWDAIKGDHQ